MQHEQNSTSDLARRPVRLGFVGTGNWARRYHLPALDHIRTHRLAGCQLVLQGICGPKSNEVKELADKYGFERAYSTLQELIDDPQIDAVAVVISPEATQQVMMQLLDKSVPLLTEKPPGADYSQAQELARCVHVPHVVGFNRRYAVLNNRFRELVQQCGEIKSVRGAMHRINRQQPHFILHAGPHLINFMEYLFGPIGSMRYERSTIAATGGQLHVGHVRFASGLPGQIELSPSSDRHWEGIEVRTEERTLILHSPHNDGAGEIIVREHGTAGNKETVLARSGEHIPLIEEGYAWEHVDLLKAVGGERPIRSTFPNAANTMRVAEAIETGCNLD